MRYDLYHPHRNEHFRGWDCKWAIGIWLVLLWWYIQKNRSKFRPTTQFVWFFLCIPQFKYLFLWLPDLFVKPIISFVRVNVWPLSMNEQENLLLTICTNVSTYIVCFLNVCFCFKNKLVMCYFNLQICTMHTAPKNPKKCAIILGSLLHFLLSEKKN